MWCDGAAFAIGWPIAASTAYLAIPFARSLSQRIVAAIERPEQLLAGLFDVVFARRLLDTSQGRLKSSVTTDAILRSIIL